MANDTDIFGVPAGRAKDADIFEDLKSAPAAPEVKAPPPEPPKRQRSYPGDAGAMLSASDLVGVFNDIMERIAYSGGGKVTDVTGSPGLGYAANVGMQAIPAMLGGAGTAKTAAPALRSAAEWVMGSALKPSAAFRASGFHGAPSKANRAISTMLDEGINVSEGGVAKLQGKVSEGKANIDALIAGSNATVDKQAVASRLQDVTKRFENQPRPEPDVAKIEDAYTEFLQGRLPNQIPVAQAQAVKEGGGGLLKKKYGQLSEVDTEIDKALVRGLKEEIAKVVPGIDKLNAHERDLLNALLLVDRRAGIAGNQNLAGLSLLANNPAAATAFMLDRSSVFKSVVARLINANQRTVPFTAGALGGGAYGAGVLSGDPFQLRGILSERR
jgi:hypothetical protein